MNNQLIKSIRMSLHLNQNEFSKLIGVGRSELANIEAGYRDVSENLVRAIRENIDLEFIKKVEEVYNNGQKILSKMQYE